MLTIVAALLSIASVASAFYHALAGRLLPCPVLQPQPDVDIDNVSNQLNITAVALYLVNTS